ncbi:MAG TPA: TIGR02147 family protein [Fibrobacteraceae bacterium]|nr:TIGR02147 family protein [Fibrobacteraceae bacterium]
MTVFEYDNYRFFLRDFLQGKKLQGLSVRSFARRCGFSSHSFLIHVLKGERNLRMDSVERLLPALDLEGREALYFRSLVHFNQAKTVQDLERYGSELRLLREKSPFARVRNDQWEYYSQWYLPVLRELAVFAPWGGDYTLLGKWVRPAITARMAREGVELLVRIGLLKKMASGHFSLRDELVSAEGVPGVIFRDVRGQYLLRAMEASQNLGREDRHVSYAVLGTSRRAFERISQKMDELRIELLESFAKGEPVECVYAVNFQAFPVSSFWGAPQERGKKSKESL